MKHNCKTQKVKFVDTLQSFGMGQVNGGLRIRVRDKATGKRKRSEVKEKGRKVWYVEKLSL